MNKLLSLVIICVLGFTNMSFAQEEEAQDNSRTKEISDIFKYEEGVSNYLQISQVEQLSNQASVNGNNSDNVVTIQQVGNSNRAFTASFTRVSDINYIQEGDNNRINSVNVANVLSEQVQQQGNNNRVFNVSVRPVNLSRLNVTQNGDNLNLVKFGSNAQTNGMQFRMSGSHQTIIVRSF